MNERAMMLLVQLNTAASYITPELATLPTETLQAYLHAPELELYRHQIADIIRVRKHVLSLNRKRCSPCWRMRLRPRTTASPCWRAWI